MIRKATVAGALLALLGAAQAEESGAPPREPYQLVRTLQTLQDEISRGNLQAHNAQPELLKRVGEEFQKADASVWNDPRNSRAVVTYLLSGGSPQVVGTLRSRNVLRVDDAFLDGAIAYIEGRPDDARARLGGINVRSLPATMGAEIALVQSALVAQSDAKAAIDRLDEARLLMPGTLVEEAALRREIFVAGQVDDFDKFEALALQYFRRFKNSIYAGNFRQRFALAVARFSFAQQADRFPRLVAVLDYLDAQQPAHALSSDRAHRAGAGQGGDDRCRGRAPPGADGRGKFRPRARAALSRGRARGDGSAHRGVAGS